MSTQRVTFDRGYLSRIERMTQNVERLADRLEDLIKVQERTVAALERLAPGHIPNDEVVDYEPPSEMKFPHIEIAEESNLIQHARAELALVHEDPSIVQGVLEMISVFSRMGHSGGSAPYFIGMLTQLMSFQPLTALTNNPDEWMAVGILEDGRTLYQSRRQSDAFSHDEGHTYYTLADRDRGLNIKHASQNYKKGQQD